MDSLGQILDLLNSRSGVLTIMLLVIVGIHRQWWYPKWAYRAMELDRDFWRSRSLQAADHADKALEIAEKVTPK